MQANVLCPPLIPPGRQGGADGSFTDPSDRERLRATAAMEELLASKLAEFLDSAFPYSLTQVPSSMKAHLYKGPPQAEEQQKGISEGILPSTIYCGSTVEPL